jgi:hypothetical protein
VLPPDHRDLLAHLSLIFSRAVAYLRTNMFVAGERMMAELA